MTVYETHHAQKSMSGRLEHDQESHQDSSDTGCQQTETSSPPDGGLTAWTQSLCMHLVFFNTWGLTNSFGTFQQFYFETLKRSQSDISWLGSVQVCLLFLVGVVAGSATDAGYVRFVFATSVALQLLGLFATSFCTEYWQILLAQGLCVGLGYGLTFCPALTILSTYFKRHRALAVGIGAAGAATGGLVYAAMVSQLIYRIGYAWTVRSMAFVMLATYMLCLIWLRSRLAPRKTGPFVDWSAFSEKTFIFFAASRFLNFWEFYFAFFFLGTFGIFGVARHLNTKNPAAYLTICIMGGILQNGPGDRLTMQNGSLHQVH